MFQYRREWWAGLTILLLVGTGCEVLPGAGSGSCGDNIIDREIGETCDGNCPSQCDDGLACTEDRMTGSAKSCDAVCAHVPISVCANNDGCCPSSCDVDEDNDCSPTCGNQQIDEGENCDPPESCPTACDDHDQCTADAIVGSAQNCFVTCSYASISQCVSADGCCPAGCTRDVDDDCSYPSGPYGKSVGNVLHNFAVFEASCSGSSLLSERELKAEEFVGSKAIMVVVSAGSCSECAQQAAYLEDKFYQKYHQQGLEIVYILTQDDRDREDRQLVLDYCCKSKDHYNMSFAVAADPGKFQFRGFSDDPPLTLVLNGDMEIRYKKVGTVPNVSELQNAIETVMANP